MEKELYYAMGVYPFFPEQFAALSAVRRKTQESEKEAVRFARIAEQAGYSSDLCGYERVVTGYVINDDLTDAPLVRHPDLVQHEHLQLLRAHGGGLCVRTPV